MSGEITFLPWLRRGLAQGLTTADPRSGALPRGVAVDAWIELEGERVRQTPKLLAPDAVAALGPGQVLRTEPRADSTGVEPNYFAYVELAAPDLPWMFTPAAPDAAQGRLRPWLVLIVVREQDGVSLGTRSGVSLPVLRIGDPAVPGDELPDLADSWGWAHVHSLVGVDEVAAAVAGRTGEVLARLMCPRRLLPDAAWLACLVPAFAGGVARGLGDPVAESDEVQPAWVSGAEGESIELPLYDFWRFTTGAGGDFEALCRRLQPDGDGAEMGLHAMDVGDPGLVDPAPRRVLVDMEGPLRTLEAAPRAWDDAAGFRGDVRKLLDAGASRAQFDPAVTDPVVAPPLYGAGPAGVAAVPATGWVRTLNLHPVRRAAAGLGARAVRAAQEALVAAAWEQAGDLVATTAALNRGRLAAEVGRSLTARAQALAPEDLLQLTGSMQAFLPAGTGSVRARIASSDVPAGLVSAAYLRQTRPGTTLARGWTARTGTAEARLSADVTRVTVAATGDGALKAALLFAAPRAPAGAALTDPTLFDHMVGDDGERRAPPGDLPGPVIDPPPFQSGVDVSDLAATVSAALDPLGAVRASVVARVPALGGLAGLPTTVPVAPEFTDPLYWDLLGLGASRVLPGVETLRRNRVRLVETGPDFVGAFLIGANHELGRELLWRGYPVDLCATFFRRFWAYLDPATTDIDPLAGWTAEASIAENMGAADQEMTAVVIRGDLIRRYPTAHVYLQAAAYGEDGEVQPVDGTEVEPDFLGALDAETVFFGWSGLDPDDVRGDRGRGVPGYFFGIEEQAGAPRFGFDDAKPAHFTGTPSTWNQASWGHLVGSQEELDSLIHARTDNPRLAALGELHGTTWGYNGAHVARATWQRPFRMLIHADLLV